jgi:hypothetical protein
MSNPVIHLASILSSVEKCVQLKANNCLFTDRQKKRFRCLVFSFYTLERKSGAQMPKLSMRRDAKAKEQKEKRKEENDH